MLFERVGLAILCLHLETFPNPLFSPEVFFFPFFRSCVYKINCLGVRGVVTDSKTHLLNSQ